MDYVYDVTIAYPEETISILKIASGNSGTKVHTIQHKKTHTHQEIRCSVCFFFFLFF